jgi:hypothetical protein
MSLGLVRLVRVLALVVMGCGIQTAHGQCILDLPNLVQLGSYDPGASAQIPAGWSLRVSTPTACAAHIQLDALDDVGRLLLQGPDEASFKVVLTQDASGSTSINTAPQDLGVVQIASSQQVTISLWAWRPTGQWLAPGQYRGRVRVSLLDNSGQVLIRRDLDFLSEVSPSVQLYWDNFASGSGSRTARLDFGELVKGAVRRASLVVQANTHHTIALESGQGGQLINSKFPHSGLNYTLRLNGQPMSLGANPSDIRIANSGKIRHELEVQIGPIERVLAGEYVDSLLVTISAQ